MTGAPRDVVPVAGHDHAWHRRRDEVGMIAFLCDLCGLVWSVPAAVIPTFGKSMVTDRAQR
jgi:hypothetical protein